MRTASADPGPCTRSRRSGLPILGNPRYTGRQVWNRQSVVHRGEIAERGRNAGSSWSVSKTLAHPALVSEADFVAAQRVRAARPNNDGVTHEYALVGLLRCGLCGRRLDAHWVHGRAGYRCRHGFASARPRPVDSPRNAYVREDVILAQLGERLVMDRDGAGGSGRMEATEMAIRLRAQGRAIVCGLTGWTLVKDG